MVAFAAHGNSQAECFSLGFFPRDEPRVRAKRPDNARILAANWPSPSACVGDIDSHETLSLSRPNAFSFLSSRCNPRPQDADYENKSGAVLMIYCICENKTGASQFYKWAATNNHLSTFSSLLSLRLLRTRCQSSQEKKHPCRVALTLAAKKNYFPRSQRAATFPSFKALWPVKCY